MKTIHINALLREETGKKSSKKLRNEENVPCVIYGGEEIVHFYAHENIFKPLVYSPDVYVVKFDINGKKMDGILQEIQFHPVSDKISHIDFVQVFDERPVIMNIPIKAIGDSEGVIAGGKIMMKRRTLKVKGLIKDMPEKLEIDVTDLVIGQSIKVHQLSFDNIEILDPQRAMVVAVISSRMTIKETEEEVEEIEGEEGEEEGEAGEGAVDTEGGSEKGAEKGAEKGYEKGYEKGAEYKSTKE